MPIFIKIGQYLAGQMDPDFCVKNYKIFILGHIYSGHIPEKLIVYPRGVVDLQINSNYMAVCTLMWELSVIR